jgi:hypothetical protein
MPMPRNWYGNLLWFDRRKCLLLTHAGTLYSVFHADVRTADLRDTHRFVVSLVGRELAVEGLPAATFGASEEQELIVAGTADRRVLGCMNDMAVLCEHVIAESGGLRRADLGDLNRALRRNIDSARGYQRPIDMAAQRLRGQHQRRRVAAARGRGSLTVGSLRTSRMKRAQSARSGRPGAWRRWTSANAEWVICA